MPTRKGALSSMTLPFPPMVIAGIKLGAGIGLLPGALYGLGGLFTDLVTTGFNLGTLLALLALIGIPLIFAVIGGGLGLIFHLLADDSIKD